MPLFMFVSGLFFRSALRKGFREVLGGKLFQLGVPSVSAFLVGWAIMRIAGTTAIADLCEASFAGFMNSVWKSCLVAPVLATAELFVCLGVVRLVRRCTMTRRLFLGEK